MNRDTSIRKQEEGRKRKRNRLNMGYETGISSDCSELRLARGDKTRSKDYKLEAGAGGKLLDLLHDTTYSAQTGSKIGFALAPH